MSYKIARVTGLINLPLRSQIEEDPTNKLLTYEQLRRKIFDAQYTYSDAFEHSMRKAGHDAVEILYDVQPLQEKWAHENGLVIDFSQPWQLKLLLSQLQAFDPDFIYFQGVTRFTPRVLDDYRHLFPNLKRYFVHTGFPGGNDQLTTNTTVFCGVPSILNTFKDAGFESHLMYHAFDSRLMDLLSIEESKNNDKSWGRRTIDFSFTGTSGYLMGNTHSHRYWDLFRLASNTPLNLWLDEKNALEDIGQPFLELPLKLKTEYYDLQENKSLNNSKPLLPLSYLLNQSQCFGAVYGLDYYKVLANSKLTFHKHTQAVHNEVGAMRLFQATGMGACLVTDTGSNLIDLFEEDTEVVTYRSLAECVEKVSYLLDNPTKAEQIAKAGQNKVITAHTYEHRYSFVRDVISQYL